MAELSNTFKNGNAGWYDDVRKIVGWAISRDLSHKFCLEALRVALRKEKPPKGIIHHSDRGVQYCSEAYVDFLNHNGFKISMSEVGTPEDNAYIESFFKTLKKEEVYFKDYLTMRDVMENLPRFIDEVYNRKRLHSALGYKTPEEYEREVLATKPAKRPVKKTMGTSCLANGAHSSLLGITWALNINRFARFD